MPTSIDTKVALKYLHLQRRARAKGIPFNLTLTAIRNMMKAKHCAYTGLLLTEESMSIDRIDARKGYVVGNVVACDREFNMRKSSLSVEDIRAICKLLDRRNL